MSNEVNTNINHNEPIYFEYNHTINNKPVLDYIISIIEKTQGEIQSLNNETKETGESTSLQEEINSDEIEQSFFKLFNLKQNFPLNQDELLSSVQNQSSKHIDNYNILINQLNINVIVNPKKEEKIKESLNEQNSVEIEEENEETNERYPTDHKEIIINKYYHLKQSSINDIPIQFLDLNENIDEKDNNIQGRILLTSSIEKVKSRNNNKYTQNNNTFPQHKANNSFYDNSVDSNIGYQSQCKNCILF